MEDESCGNQYSSQSVDSKQYKLIPRFIIKDIVWVAMRGLLLIWFYKSGFLILFHDEILLNHNVVEWEKGWDNDDSSLLYVPFYLCI